ncbi:MAG: tryptophan-rich sensory protein [Firmicutes bacterium]|nr:tryptophan-rich sensory protein [Bacillota bacterium]
MKSSIWNTPFLWIAFVLGVGWLSGFLSGDISGVYALLEKPPLSPPGQIFPVVWTILYLLMGIAAWLVSRSEGPCRGPALFWFFVQLALNFSWSIVFFRFGLHWAALAILVLLDILVIHTIRLFRKQNPTAAWLMVPYLLWILFATYLNAALALLN